MNHFDLLLAKKLAEQSGGGGGGSSIPLMTATITCTHGEFTTVSFENGVLVYKPIQVNQTDDYKFIYAEEDGSVYPFSEGAEFLSATDLVNCTAEQSGNVYFVTITDPTKDSSGTFTVEGFN